jgi:outer membrane protein OmpA-like peptidoglycan-associated protein
MVNTQNASQPSGGMTSTIRTGPTPAKEQSGTKVRQINLKEVALVAAGILFVGGLIAGYWVYTQQGQSNASGPTVSSSEAQAHADSSDIAPIATAVAVPSTVPVPSKSMDTMHADVYFDFDRSRLRADAVGILQEKAAILKQDATWVVLIQGYADQNGPGEYNKALASRRAGAVKQFLVESGVPENSIKVAAVGQAISICDDPSKECQRLNRRVHLEMIKRNVPAAAMDQARSSASLLPVVAEDADVAEGTDISESHVKESTNTEPPGTATSQ